MNDAIAAREIPASRAASDGDHPARNRSNARSHFTGDTVRGMTTTVLPESSRTADRPQ